MSDFGSPVIVFSLEECRKELWKVPRCAMLKIPGCMNSTCLEAVEILTNTPSIDLHLNRKEGNDQESIQLPNIFRIHKIFVQSA